MSKSGPRPKKKRNTWVLQIIAITFGLALGMSLVAEALQASVSVFVAVGVLLLFILTGILFDIVGIAVASADITPFVAMASKKVPGAASCLFLVKRADRVSNFCNDVVGDVCGIVSGAMGAAISLQIMQRLSAGGLWVPIVVSSVIAAMTVGGKALGKTVALTRRKQIVYAAGRALSLFIKA